MTALRKWWADLRALRGIRVTDALIEGLAGEGRAMIDRETRATLRMLGFEE